MAVKVLSATYSGIMGKIITVEVDITRGLPSFNMVGLADTSVKESKERVRSSIINSGFDFPVSRITVNLAPADIKKEGSLFDLPIAIGILIATGQITNTQVTEYLIMGELSLSGEIKKIKGALPIAVEASENGIKNLMIPSSNENECSIVKGLSLHPFNSLSEVIYFFNNGEIPKINFSTKNNIALKENLDFSDVNGQESTKRAIEVAASGFHNLVLYGPPGSGKTMLASRIPSILPKLTYEEALEVTKIYSVSGNLTEDIGIVSERPFRSPHHTSSKLALTGGGNKLIPGEITLAHNGVLFLDEILEFNRNVLEVLRQPLEERCIKISRATGSIVYPANFMLIAALNPCTCGFFGTNRECTCNDFERKRYLKKLSGPLIDRIDLFSSVRELPFDELSEKHKNKSSKEIREGVNRARKIQKLRFSKEQINYNAQMNENHMKRYCALNKETRELMKNIYEKYELSNRAYSRILKVARTIADLENKENIEKIHLLEALNYRRFIDEKII